MARGREGAFLSGDSRPESIPIHHVENRFREGVEVIATHHISMYRSSLLYITNVCTQILTKPGECVRVPQR